MLGKLIVADDTAAMQSDITMQSGIISIDALMPKCVVMCYLMLRLMLRLLRHGDRLQYM